MKYLYTKSEKINKRRQAYYDDDRLDFQNLIRKSNIEWWNLDVNKKESTGALLFGNTSNDHVIFKLYIL